MPDIEFRLTAVDEATPVIERTRQTLEKFNKTYSAPMGGGSSASGSSGGMSGILGKGGIGNLAGLTIIGQGILQVLQKTYAVLAEASPYLASVSQQFKTAADIYLRPMGDSIARLLQPSSEEWLELSEARSELFAQMEEDYGPVAVILATLATALGDAWTAVLEFQWGMLNALSSIVMWPIDKLGDMLGVDLPGSLDELLEKLFGITGGFDGIKKAVMEDLPEKLGEAWDGMAKWFESGIAEIGEAIGGFGTWLWNSITGAIGNIAEAVSGFGSWIWSGITGALSGAWSTISGFGTWIYNSLKTALGGIGYEAYKAFHNAIASMLNGIANIELPLVGKPFKGLFGTIPMLASGGIVTQPTLAMIGERGAEAVIPLNKAGQLGMGQGMNVTIQMNAPVYGVDDLERTIRDMMSREQLGYTGYR